MAWRNIELLIGAIWGALLLAGCVEPQQPRVELTQPQLSGVQGRLSLRTEQAVWASCKGGQDARPPMVLRVLAEFPLPGAATGRPAYLVYLRLPGSVTTQPADVGPKAGGFFIQTRGMNAGLAEITGGRVETLARAGQLTVRLDVTCEDGTRLKGEVLARQDESALRDFEQYQHAADVEAVRRRIE